MIIQKKHINDSLYYECSTLKNDYSNISYKLYKDYKIIIDCIIEFWKDTTLENVEEFLQYLEEDFAKQELDFYTARFILNELMCEAPYSKSFHILNEPEETNANDIFCKNFEKAILETIEKHSLFTKEHDKLLMALSGGIDSTTLFYVLKSLGYNIEIAHCNFNLRGQESKFDELSVKKIAKYTNTPYFIKRFNTTKYAEKHRISIEMAARELRYAWFQELCNKHGFTKIVVAHNQNDTIETFFINLLRGSGIKGLQGIPITNGNIVRPMLTITRSDIEKYCKIQLISYNVDITNLSNKYTRNKIRNIVLPVFQQISPDALSSINTSLKHIQQSYAFYKEAIDKEIKEIVTYTPQGCKIEEKLLINHPHRDIITFEILQQFGFKSDVIQQIVACFGTQSGKKFESPTHRAIHDRNILYVKKIQKHSDFQKSIDVWKDQTIQTPIGILESKIYASLVTRIVKNNSLVLQFDVDKLGKEITIRTWKQGDKIIPFGMKGSKKISDYLIDAKVPIHEKEKILVIESNGTIVGIIGHTIHNFYAVTSETEMVYNLITIKDNVDTKKLITHPDIPNNLFNLS
ncbi:MAG TPA: tRNA lysidine(34) synthetase TilS [Bacteroidales bacterium]|nr:tRNA lysidine(34) synthetase TilS [Bacteroidales bacterium]